MSAATPLPVTTIKIPNPFVEGRNRVYVIHSDPVTLIDAGIATEKARGELQQGLQEAGVAVESIGRIILTHKHVDHIGSAWWLQQESGAEIFIHEIETHAVSDVDPEGHRWRKMVRGRFDRWAVPEDARPRDQREFYAWDLRAATPTAIQHGQAINLNGVELQVLHTPGHTKGSVCLRMDGVLFSGDHVLPDVSPNIGGGDLRHEGLLTDYLKSLQDCVDLAPEIEMVLPGHGDAFSNLAERCQNLLDHHKERLDKVLHILRSGGPQTTYAVAEQLFGKLRKMHLVLGCAEAQSHLDHLVKTGQLTVHSETYAVV